MSIAAAVSSSSVAMAAASSPAGIGNVNSWVVLAIYVIASVVGIAYGWIVARKSGPYAREAVTGFARGVSLGLAMLVIVLAAMWLVGLHS